VSQRDKRKSTKDQGHPKNGLGVYNVGGTVGEFSIFQTLETAFPAI
jgi:hypothetical protein